MWKFEQLTKQNDQVRIEKIALFTIVTRIQCRMFVLNFVYTDFTIDSSKSQRYTAK